MTLNQWTYGGLTMGAGTDYRIQQHDGFRGHAPITISDPPHTRADGSWPGWSFLAPRVIILTMLVVPSDGTLATLESDWQALGNALGRIQSPNNLSPLAALLSSSWSYPRQCLCRPSRAPIVVTPADLASPLMRVVAEFTAPDPLLYDSNVQSVVLTPTGPTGGGPHYGWTFTGVCTNGGNVTTWPIFTVSALDGEYTTAQISDGVRTLQWNAGMANSPWTIDVQNQTITDNTGANQDSAIVAGSTWPLILPGANTITASGTSGVTPYVHVGFSNAWDFA